MPEEGFSTVVSEGPIQSGWVAGISPATAL